MCVQFPSENRLNYRQVFVECSLFSRREPLSPHKPRRHQTLNLGMTVALIKENKST